MFDCGSVNKEAFSTHQVCFVTHGHIDHIGAIIPYARAKSLSYGSTIVYVPADVVSPLMAAKDAYDFMGNESISLEIRSISPGDPPVRISDRISVIAFPTLHRVPSQGYGVVVTYKGAVKDEYASSTAQDFKEMRQNGIDFRHPDREICEVVYTGDTVFKALLPPELNFIFEAELLIMECTYVDGPQEKAKEYSHIHVGDIVDSVDRFRNKQLFIVHVSQKYRADYIIQSLRSTLPRPLVAITAVNLKLHGYREYLTPLSDESHAKRLREEPGWGWGGGKTSYGGDRRGRGKGRSAFSSGRGRGNNLSEFTSKSAGGY